MGKHFTPTAVDDVKYLIIVMTYIASGKSMRYVAKKFRVGKTTVWRYVHRVSELDSRLAELVEYKVSVVTSGQTVDRFVISPALKAHLDHVISKLAKRSTLPENISSYIWDEYITKKCNH